MLQPDASDGGAANAYHEKIVELKQRRTIGGDGEEEWESVLRESAAIQRASAALLKLRKMRDDSWILHRRRERKRRDRIAAAQAAQAAQAAHGAAGTNSSPSERSSASTRSSLSSHAPAHRGRSFFAHTNTSFAVGVMPCVAVYLGAGGGLQELKSDGDEFRKDGIAKREDGNAERLAGERRHGEGASALGASFRMAIRERESQGQGGKERGGGNTTHTVTNAEAATAQRACIRCTRIAALPCEVAQYLSGAVAECNVRPGVHRASVSIAHVKLGQPRVWAQLFKDNTAVLLGPTMAGAMLKEVRRRQLSDLGVYTPDAMVSLEDAVAEMAYEVGYALAFLHFDADLDCDEVEVVLGDGSAPPQYAAGKKSNPSDEDALPLTWLYLSGWSMCSRLHVHCASTLERQMSCVSRIDLLFQKNFMSFPALQCADNNLLQGYTTCLRVHFLRHTNMNVRAVAKRVLFKFAGDMAAAISKKPSSIVIDSDREEPSREFFSLPAGCDLDVDEFALLMGTDDEEGEDEADGDSGDEIAASRAESDSVKKPNGRKLISSSMKWKGETNEEVDFDEEDDEDGEDDISAVDSPRDLDLEKNSVDIGVLALGVRGREGESDEPLGKRQKTQE